MSVIRALHDALISEGCVASIGVIMVVSSLVIIAESIREKSRPFMGCWLVLAGGLIVLYATVARSATRPAFAGPELVLTEDLSTAEGPVRTLSSTTADIRNLVFDSCSGVRAYELIIRGHVYLLVGLENSMTFVHAVHCPCQEKASESP